MVRKKSLTAIGDEMFAPKFCKKIDSVDQQISNIGKTVGAEKMNLPVVRGQAVLQLRNKECCHYSIYFSTNDKALRVPHPSASSQQAITCFCKACMLRLFEIGKLKWVYFETTIKN